MAEEWNGPSVLVAFVRTSLDEGPILMASGEFLVEVRDGSGGLDIGDYSMPMPSAPGLQIFEGWLEVGPGDDPDVNWVGEWRQFSHWEMSRMRFGLPPTPECDDPARQPPPPPPAKQQQE